MSRILDEICQRKGEYVQARKQRVTIAELEQRALQATPPRGFAKALREPVAKGETALIAEIKKASPSGGLIRENFDPTALASAYAEAGADCLSVLTDAPYFQGEDAYLAAARDACLLPVLRKDFMLDPYQIIESRALGADAILLIMAALTDSQARDLNDTAQALGMDVLVEVHDEAELERALALDARLIGVNNRNLQTMQTDLAVSERLQRLMPAEVTMVCESGIRDRTDIERMQKQGIYAFLVGESLMRQQDLARATQALLGR